MLKRTGAWLRRWCASPRGPVLVLVLGVIVGAGLLGTGNAVLSATGTEKFCTTSCHEMSHNNEEYKGTIHDVNRTGVRATCVDCHTPKQGLPYYLRKLYAVQELWGHFVTHSIDTEEKFEAKRYELAVRVWTYMKKSDSRECKACHNMDKIDPDRGTEKAQVRHAKAKAENMACIDCHFGIAHNEPEGGPGPQELSIR